MLREPLLPPPLKSQSFIVSPKEYNVGLWLIIIALALPVVAGIFAVPQNPNGWMSNSIASGYLLITLHPLGWLALIIALWGLLYRPLRLIFGVILLVCSFIYSIFTYQMILNASDSEFVG